MRKQNYSLLTFSFESKQTMSNEESSIELKPKAEPGTAALKSEYLISNHVRLLNTEFVAVKDKNAAGDVPENDNEGPPRKKLKGQNKHRPREKKQPRSEKLCFSMGNNVPCRFAESCPYGHDVVAYLKDKPADIGKTCYVYETYGKCLYGFSCRYGSQHIDGENNLINDELCAKVKDQKYVLNTLTKELQIALRKRTYNFEASNKVLNELKEVRDYRNCQPEKLRANISIFSSLQSVLPNRPSVGDGNKECANVGTESLNKDGASVNSSNENLDKSVMNCIFVDSDLPLHRREIKKIDFTDKLFLAPLTTVGNLPFRRLCKEFGVDITCSEMVMAYNLLSGGLSNWALLKRHHTEDIFGIQLCGAHADVMTQCSQLLSENLSFDFIDINMGCPLDAVYRRGAGSGLMNRTRKLEEIIYGISSVTNVPLTLKMRTGIHARDHITHDIINHIHAWGNPVQLITLHGRSREQRYTKYADWEYIDRCSKLAHPVPLFGSGDILTFEDYNLRRRETSVSGIMIARGALIKPWIFKEIKEQKHWDISSSERFDILKRYVNYGLEHWGSDTEGVEKTRRFLLEWLSFLHRYIPVGLLERVPQRINERPPLYRGRDDLETLMASASCADWIKISEMLLGPISDNFTFLPKHKANAYQ